MAETSRDGNRIPVGGVILLFLGVLFLLQALGVWPWDLWLVLWRYWPVLLITAGLGLVLRRYNPWLVSLLLLAVLFASVGLALWQYNVRSPAATAKSYSVPAAGLERAEVKMNFTAGSMQVVSLDAGAANLVELVSSWQDAGFDFQKTGSEGKLQLTTEGARRDFDREPAIRWDIGLNRAVPLSIDMKSAASNVHLNLRDLQVTELKMDVDAGNFGVWIPAAAGLTRANIVADVVDLEIRVPSGVSARIKLKGDLTAVFIDEARFPKQGDYFISPDFETAKNRVDIQIECHLGRLQVHS